MGKERVDDMEPDNHDSSVLTDVEPHLQILQRIAKTVCHSLDVEEVLHTALDALTRVTGHEISSLHLVAEDGVTLALRGDRGLSPALREVNRTLRVGHGVIGGVVATGVSARVVRMTEDRGLLEAARPAVERAGIRGFVCVPIQSRGRVLGALSLGRQTEAGFSDREVALLEATADQIGMALDNARLYSESQRQLEELRRMQAHLVQAEKLKAVGQLSAGVAHEVNNPLTVILGRTELLLSTATTPELQHGLRIVAEHTSRAARIVRNLLLFSRQYEPTRRPVSLVDQVEQVLELTSYDLQRARVQVVKEFAPCPPVLADANQLQQVILNIVQNAHQAMAAVPEIPRLTIRVHGEGDHADLEIEDSGPGIPDDVLPRIFDPFFTTKPAGEGTGLGLSVSYGIVAAHGGVLRAAKGANGGAVFSIELPALAAAGGTESDTPACVRGDHAATVAS
jgi:C4-dicarboxylate-specific signal transduction histidine kinase